MTANHVDALVVGGGLLGCATAWMIAREGASVLLAERDQLNRHASGQNAGSLHFQLEYRMVEHGIEAAKKAAEAMPLHLQAAKLWSELAETTGEHIEVKQVGGLMIAESAAQAELLERKSEIERSWGLDVRVVDRTELTTLAPYLAESVVAAAYCPLEGKADTRVAAPALARAAMRTGAEIRTRCEVIEMHREPGRWQVTLRENDTTQQVVAGAVILAAGVWTSELGDMVGAKLPTVPLALTMTVTLRVPHFIHHLVQHAEARLSLKQSLEGNVLIGGGWPARLLHTPDGKPDFTTPPELLRDSLAGNAQAAIRTVPAVAKLPALRSWVGVTTITPDQLPLVGPVPGAAGMFVATGGSAFTLGPSFAMARYATSSLAVYPRLICQTSIRVDTKGKSCNPHASPRSAAGRIEFTFNGEPITAYEGETVATALLAARVAAFGRTREGDPRVPLCNMGTCFECVVTVDEQRLVRSCLTDAQAGLHVSRNEAF